MANSAIRTPSVARPLLLSVVILLFRVVLASAGDRVFVGADYPFVGNVQPAATQTLVDYYSAANASGLATAATFGWSATGCPGAAGLRFYHRLIGTGLPPELVFFADRGPFDVTGPLQPSGTVPPVTTTVALDPPVTLEPGDVIGITNLTTCGGPTWSLPAGPLPTLPPATLVFSGDVRSRIFTSSASSTSTFYAFVHASGPASGLTVLNDRFEIRLSATNPRTGATTTGIPVALGGAAGYFSLPAFTGDASFPEIMVKMVDATAAPPPFGGAFWFFYSSLTDVTYTLTVTDHVRSVVRTYESAGSPEFCGRGDTNAFPP